MYNVILVDDEPWELRGLEKVFRWHDSGCRIVGMFADSVDALKAIVERQPDIVFTDIRMPEINGIELLRQARKAGAGAEFVMISGFAEFAYAQEALREGAADYWLKPIMIDEADDMLHRLLRKLDEKRSAAAKADVPAHVHVGEKGVAEPAQEAGNGVLPMIAFIHDNIGKNLSLKELAAHFYLHSSYCSELFKKTTGQTFSDYVKDLRMKKAAELLKDPKLTVADVCRRVGYNDYFYFIKAYKKYYGITPAKYSLKCRRG